MTDQRFQQQLDSLARQEAGAAGVQLLSDLSREQQAQVRAWWAGLPVARRQHLTAQLVELAELSVELEFSRVFLVALDDPDPQVRATAIDGLWENESLTVLRRLVELLEHDQDQRVQVAVLRALARFALLASTGALDADWAERLRTLLLRAAEARAASLEARRRAVEAVAVFTDDDAVRAVIADAYADPHLPMRASALYAMGRNLDPHWLDTVLKELRSQQPMLRYEAARASGELGSQRAVPVLLEMLADPDREAQLAAVAALGKLGGRAAGTALRKLLDSDDEGLREAAEDALDELNFGANPLMTG
jgi:HEAT repeat protein